MGREIARTVASTARFHEETGRQRASEMAELEEMHKIGVRVGAGEHYTQEPQESPDALLAELRALMEQAGSVPEGAERAWMAEVVGRFQKLDGWLSGGINLPNGWAWC